MTPGSKILMAHCRPCYVNTSCFWFYLLKEIEKMVFSYELPWDLLICASEDSIPGPTAMPGTTVWLSVQQLAVVSRSLPCFWPRWDILYVVRITTSVSPKSFMMALISGIFSEGNIALYLLFWEASLRGFLYSLYKCPPRVRESMWGFCHLLSIYCCYKF